MIPSLHKILLSLSFLSACILSINCNRLCRFDSVSPIELSEMHGSDLSHEPSAPQEESDCEWDTGSINISYKEKFFSSFAHLSFLSSYIFFVDSLLNIEIAISELRDSIFPIDVHSDPIFSLNTIRILI